MAPEVVVRKLDTLRSLLAELEKHAGATAEEIRRDPYRVERLLELLVTAAADLLSHLLAERGEQPGTYKETFRQAGEQGLITSDLSDRFQRAAGMRNVLVHLYEDIDYGIVHESVGQALRDFPELIRALEPLAGR
ncbi:MAG TPA: DUF86 domain-containing protein [Thermoanaerobaculia bacterium]|nr:DUF86 domain-containing protein [Thermoanaerobaculia bacterium]